VISMTDRTKLLGDHDPAPDSQPVTGVRLVQEATVPHRSRTGAGWQADGA
jgi:hypothetical protein